MPTRQQEANMKKQEQGDKQSLSSRPKDAATNGAYHNSGKKDATDCTAYWDDPETMEHNQKEYKKFLDNNRKARKDSQEAQNSDDSISKKRSRGKNSSAPGTPSKKQKGNDAKQKTPSTPAGSITRVPEKGQQAQWHALPGWVDGEVLEVLYEEKEVDGKKVKASKEDPRIVLKSNASGKICVHKPDAVHFG
ncbi:hypothetical protein NX059_004088 [Plenodomus lindquistii]|nr:hypothetical protein NX059_004088 [Plenodomus lindquistii]